MDDLIIIEAADDVHDGIPFADMGKKLVAESLKAIIVGTTVAEGWMRAGMFRR